jgi:hypothetical protein
MKLLLIFAVAALSLARGNAGDTPELHQSDISPVAAPASLPSDANVNSRYTVESVELDKPIRKRISKSLLEETQQLVGQKFDPNTVGRLAFRIRNQVRMWVSHKIERGEKPEHVRVIYETDRRWEDDDTEITKLAYHHKQGWTGGFELNFDVEKNTFRVGIQSDGDELLERFAGLSAGYARQFSESIGFRVDFNTLHQQWNRATILALEDRPDVPGIYRRRHILSPAVEIRLHPSLLLTTGVSLQQFELQYPAARYETSNAVENTLRYLGRWESSSTSGQELDAGYNLRAATRILNSDVAYTRHHVYAEYVYRQGKNTLMARAQAGRIFGEAPLFDRFLVGNTETLRGWHKYDIAPIGGTRLAHGTVQYMYRFFGFFYDTGSVWDHQADAEVRHSVGVTVGLGAIRRGPYLTLAFPLRSGAITPLFMMAMNF